MNQASRTTAEFRCPGEPEAISRAVHLGRLAALFPKCRDCPHRTDTGSFSRKRAKRLAEAHAGAPSPALLDAEGITGALLNDCTPRVARRAGAAFGLLLRESRAEADWPTVVLAGDGRRLTSPLVAAAAEGLRFAGCHVTDLGQATSGYLAFALGRSRADGGLLVGNAGHRPHEAALRFWHTQGPLVRDGTLAQALSLERLEVLLRGNLDRPAREFGTLRRASLEADYLASLADFYHGLRPLVVVLDTPCRPLADYVRVLSESLECQFVGDPSDTPEGQIRRQRAHFGVQIDGNGETCRVLDERANRVGDERLLCLVARQLLGRPGGGFPQDTAAAPTIVVEEETTAETQDVLRRLGCRVVCSCSSRAAMHQAIAGQQAVLGGGPSGRFWYARSGFVSPDALVTLSLLVVILSQSDRPLSQVLDEWDGAK